MRPELSPPAPPKLASALLSFESRYFEVGGERVGGKVIPSVRHDVRNHIRNVRCGGCDSDKWRGGACHVGGRIGHSCVSMLDSGEMLWVVSRARLRVRIPLNHWKAKRSQP